MKLFNKSNFSFLAYIFFLVFFSTNVLAKENLTLDGITITTDYPRCEGQISQQWQYCYGEVRYPNGNIYLGEFLDGLRQGNGIIKIVAIGDSNYTNIRSVKPATYIGSFLQNKLDGEGILKYDDGELVDGVFKENILVNVKSHIYPSSATDLNRLIVEGISLNTSYSKCEGQISREWVNCYGAIRYPNGNIYLGDYWQGMRHGYGILKIAARGNSDNMSIRTAQPATYIGNFSQNRLNGRGIFKFDNGEIIVGNFNSNILTDVTAQFTLYPTGSVSSPTNSYGYGGVGININVLNGRVKINNVIEGTPAFLAGIRTGDELLKINDIDLSNYSEIQIINLARGEPGSEVKLTIFRESLGHPVDVLLTRTVIKTPKPACSDPDRRNWNMCVGTVNYPNGNIYQGEFVNGLREGIGSIRIVAKGESDNFNIRSNEPVTYVGQFKNNKLNGIGYLVYDNGNKIKAEFVNNILVNILEKSISPSHNKPKENNQKSREVKRKGAQNIASGTGFFISTNGYIATNLHVVLGAKKIIVKDYYGKEYICNIVLSDRANDLAVLKTNLENHDFLKIMTSFNILKGMEVFTIGYPNPEIQGLESKVTNGIISSLSGVMGQPGYFQISVPIQPGNSGGPLLDYQGNVVGLTSSKLSPEQMLKMGKELPENVNYAVKSDYLIELIKTNHNIFESIKVINSQTNKLPLSEVVNKTEKAIVFINSIN